MTGSLGGFDPVIAIHSRLSSALDSIHYFRSQIFTYWRTTPAVFHVSARTVASHEVNRIKPILQKQQSTILSWVLGITQKLQRMQRLTNCQFYVVFIYIFLVGISSVTVAQDLIPIEEKEKTQILKELNAKWDGDMSAIVTWDVHYRRCLVAYENLKKFVPEDIIRLVNVVPKDKSTSIFDYFFDNLVDLNSYEKLEGSTQTPRK